MHDRPRRACKRSVEGCRGLSRQARERQPRAIERTRYSSTSQACCALRGLSRRRRGVSTNMNATATIAPAGPQHMRALERANQVRLARAELKRRIAAGEIAVAEVILECPWETESMAVADLL